MHNKHNNNNIQTKQIYPEYKNFKNQTRLDSVYIYINMYIQSI